MLVLAGKVANKLIISPVYLRMTFRSYGIFSFIIKLFDEIFDFRDEEVLPQVSQGIGLI